MSRTTSVPPSCKEKPFCPSCSLPFAFRDAVHLMGARSKCPMILQCGHTVCLGCLRAVSRLQRAFRCPICLQDTDVPDNRNWKQLPINYHILGFLCASRMQDVDASFMLKLVPSAKKKTAASALALETDFCAECNSKMVSFECVQCERLMCKKCFKEVHEANSLCVGHFVRPVLSAGNHPLRICHEHDKIREFYCNDDDEVICANCALIGSHKGHDVTLVSEKNKTRLPDVKAALEKARKISKCLKYSERELKELLRDAEKETKSSALSIRRQFLSLHAALQLREQALFEELGTRANRQSKAMQEMLENLEKSYYYVQAVTADAEAQLDNPSRLVNPDWLENLTCIETLPCFLQVSEEERRSLMKKFSPKTVIEDALFPQMLSCASLNGEEDDDEQDDIHPTLAALNRVPDHTLEEMPDEDDSSSMPDLEALNDTDEASEYSQESRASNITINTTATSREVQYHKNWRQRNVLLKPQPLRDLKLKPRNFNMNKQELVRVVHIKTPSEFYVHRHTDAHTLKQLEDGIAQYCRRMKKCSTPPEIEKGGMYLASYDLDRRWYRACVKNILGSDDTPETQDTQDVSDTEKEICQKNGLKDMELKVEVEYIDYGNSGVVCVSQLIPLPEELSELPTMALKCTLWQIDPIDKEYGWSIDAIETFVKFVVEEKKLVEMTVIRQIGDVLHIDLGDAEQSDSPSPTPLSVREALVFLEFGHFSCPVVSSDHDTRPLTNKFDVFYDYLAPAQHESFEVLVSHIVSAENFYVQKLGECNNHLTGLMFQMKEVYSNNSSASPLFGPSVGMPCAALYSDGLWYRAEITALKGGKAVEVFYVDYGNKETVSYTRVRKLHKNFLKLSKMALHCRLADIKLKSVKDDANADLTKDAHDFFRSEVYLKVLNLIVEDTSEKPLSVSLYRVDEDEEELKEVCLNAEMVSKGYAISTGPCSNKPSVRSVKVKPPPSSNDSAEISKVVQNGTLPLNKLGNKVNYNFEIHISHIESPDCIFVQLVSKEEILKSLMKNLQVTYNQTMADDDHEWEEDAFCVALNPGDKCWYRGKISCITVSDAFEVFLFDYGEKAVVSQENLREILEKFLKEPAFAFACRLTGIVASGGSNKWPALAVDHLQELASKYDSAYLKTMGPMVDGVLPVSIYAEEVTLASALEPTITTYISFSEQLVDQGLALPTERKSKSKQNGSFKPEESNGTETSSKEEKGKDASTSSQVTLDKSYLALQNWSKKWKPVQFTAQAGYKFKAVPTYVTYDASIYLHDAHTGATILQFIQTTLKDRFEGSVPQSHDLYWFKGQACISQFDMDSLWYRAEVLDVKGNEIEVKFIDYGNVEKVRPDQLRKDIILTDIAQQGIMCDLYNIEPLTEDGTWPVKIIDFIHKLIVETLCEVTVMVPPQEDQNVKISLIVIPEANVENTLVEINYARLVPKNGEEPDVYITQELDFMEIQPSYEDLIFPPVGEIFQVSITEVTGPDTFYIQRMKNADLERAYQNEINEQCEMLLSYIELMNTCAETWELIDNPKIGQPCCARYSDSSWFRAVVTNIDEEKGLIGVSYIDYGNEEFVDLERLRELPEELLKLPKQAILCKLHQVAPVTTWTPEIDEKMRHIYEIADGSLFVVIKDFDSPVSVDLLRSEGGTLSSSSTELAYQSLIDDGLIRMVRERTSEELM